MALDPEFLEPDAVLFLHEQALKSYGGQFGLRDENLLLSALARPQNRVAYEADDVDLFDLAASYAFGIARNHAFSDANKRTSWSSCVLFLRLNGIGIAAEVPEIVAEVVALAEGRRSEGEFAAWLRTRRRG